MTTALVSKSLKSLIASLFVAFVAVTTSSPAHGQADACASDLDGDGIVAGADLALVLGNWGPCKACDGDVNGDHFVDGVDLAFVLTRWGGTCAPTVTGITPAAGPLAGGVEVSLIGNNLLNPLRVTFGSIPATILSSTRTSITVLAPVRSAGAVEVVAATQGGYVLAGIFSYYDAPTITHVTPNVGYAGGGQSVTVSGSGFFGTPIVRLGDATAASVLVVSATQLRLVLPPGKAGSTVSLTVSTQSGVAELSNAFTYVTIDAPSWATLIEAAPDPDIVTIESTRNAIIATGLPWRVRDKSTRIEMVLIPPGTFDMGCSPPTTQPCPFDARESPVHQVTLTNAFYLGRYEVTQAQWLGVMGSNPSSFQSASAQVPAPEVSHRPVEFVSWDSVQGFLSATGMRLPTEAEWEYGYRAGTTTAFHGWAGQPAGTSDNAAAINIGWYTQNAGGDSMGQTHPVGQKPGNGFGLHDMAGNVFEWVSDWYEISYYAASPSTNPLGPSSGIGRVLRGGAWNKPPFYVRSSWRQSNSPTSANDETGFRVARNP